MTTHKPYNRHEVKRVLIDAERDYTNGPEGSIREDEQDCFSVTLSKTSLFMPPDADKLKDDEVRE